MRMLLSPCQASSCRSQGGRIDGNRRCRPNAVTVWSLSIEARPFAITEVAKQCMLPGWQKLSPFAVQDAVHGPRRCPAEGARGTKLEKAVVQSGLTGGLARQVRPGHAAAIGDVPDACLAVDEQ